MHCPYCGDQLVEHDGGLKCVRGQMQLSGHLSKCLHDSFIIKTDPPKQVAPSTLQFGGTWFCPACGIEMQQPANTNGMLCARCNGNLGPFVWELVELNYHRKFVEEPDAKDRKRFQDG